MPATLEIKEDRVARTAAFREVQRMVADFHGVKLNDKEAEVIEQASEDLLLAFGPEDPAITAALAAFNALMDRLESGRWVRGSDEQPAAGLLLRRAVAGCVPA